MFVCNSASQPVNQSLSQSVKRRYYDCVSAACVCSVHVRCCCCYISTYKRPCVSFRKFCFCRHIFWQQFHVVCNLVGVCMYVSVFGVRIWFGFQFHFRVYFVFVSMPFDSCTSICMHMADWLVWLTDSSARNTKWKCFTAAHVWNYFDAVICSSSAIEVHTRLGPTSSRPSRSSSMWTPCVCVCASRSHFTSVKI